MHIVEQVEKDGVMQPNVSEAVILTHKEESRFRRFIRRLSLIFAATANTDKDFSAIFSYSNTDSTSRVEPFDWSFWNDTERYEEEDQDQEDYPIDVKGRARWSFKAPKFSMPRVSVKDVGQTRGRSRWRKNQDGAIRVVAALGLAGIALLGGLGYGAKSIIDSRYQPATPTPIAVSKDLPSVSSKQGTTPDAASKPAGNGQGTGQVAPAAPEAPKFGIARFEGKDGYYARPDILNNGDVSSVEGAVQAELYKIYFDDYLRVNNQLSPSSEKLDIYKPEHLAIAEAYRATDKNYDKKIAAGMKFFHDNNPGEAFSVTMKRTDGSTHKIVGVLLLHNDMNGKTADYRTPLSWDGLFHSIDISNPV